MVTVLSQQTNILHCVFQRKPLSVDCILAFQHKQSVKYRIIRGDQSSDKLFRVDFHQCRHKEPLPSIF
jgi:hypothetical protein